MNDDGFQLDMFPNGEVKEDLSRLNPMVRVYGTGPQGTKCASCKEFVTIQPGQNTYFKCLLRGITHGPGTDHRKYWQTCGKYDPGGADRWPDSNVSKL